MSKRTAAQETSSANKAAKKEKVVLAYSGGLDTSVILVWLVEKVRFDIQMQMQMLFPHVLFLHYT